MLVSGLTIIRNGLRFGYPFLEAIRSVLPICDEFVVVVGDSDDGTREAVAAIDDPRIRIVDSYWSPWVSPRMCTLAQQTNLGLHQCRGRWCVYVQGNEVVHEDSLPALRDLMQRHAEDPAIEAILLERLTFWADFAHVFAVYPRLFKFSVRIVKPHIGMHSIRDAMSFAVFDNWSLKGRYPQAIDSGQWLYRYANVRAPALMAAKGDAVHKDGARTLPADFFQTRYPRQFFARFTGCHPAVMAERQGVFPAQYDLADPANRSSLTRIERLRLWETAWYRRFGFPKRRTNRYRLVGDYLPKQRPG